MKYILSKDVVLVNPVDMVLKNLSSGERMEVSAEVINLLAFFKKPTTVESAIADIGVVEEETLLVEHITQLIEGGVLVEFPEKEIRRGEMAMLLSDQALVQGTNFTFFNSPRADKDELEERSIVFLGAPFDLGTTGYPGTRFAPDKLREISADSFEYHADIFDGTCRGWYLSDQDKYILRGIKLSDLGNVIHQVGESFDSFFGRITKVVKIVLEGGSFPVVIGGDHSITYGIMKACKNCFDRMGLIHIDAHTDLADMIPGIPNNHGNMCTRLLEENLVHQLVHVGVRGFTGKESRDDRYVRQFLSSDQIVDESVLEKIDTSLKYHVTFDIDVLDPSIAPGTGTAEPFGLRDSQVRKLLRLIASNVDVVSFDLVEVNPMRDENDRTSYLAHSLLVEFLSHLSQFVKS